MACIAKRRERYVIDFYDQYGKRQRKTLPKRTKKSRVREILREIEEQVDNGEWLPQKKTPTFKEVAEDWIAHKKGNLRITTWEVYKGHTENHFNEVEILKINRITTATVEKWIATRQKTGMKKATLRKILVTFGQIMGYAVRHRYIDHNPVRDAERPRGKGQEVKKKTAILTIEQINSFLKKVTDKKYETLFMLAVLSGARQGELLGLKWSDVDFQNSQIHIQRTYNKRRFFSTKTQESNRKVDIGPTMMKVLKKWRLACPPNDLGLVFPNKAGQPINYSNMVQRFFKPTLKAAGLPMIRFHDLRHTTASLMIEQGENIKYIQSQLGHSNPTVTLNVYAHLLKPTNQKAACRLEQSVFGL